jgi:hypothetical protein
MKPKGPSILNSTGARADARFNVSPKICQPSTSSKKLSASLAEVILARPGSMIIISEAKRQSRGPAKSLLLFRFCTDLP